MIQPAFQINKKTGSKNVLSELDHKQTELKAQDIGKIKASLVYIKERYKSNNKNSSQPESELEKIFKKPSRY